jgi:hypothetical protein
MKNAPGVGFAQAAVASGKPMQTPLAPQDALP